MANPPDNIEQTEFEMPALFVPPTDTRPQAASVPVAPAPPSRPVPAVVPVDDPIGECLMRFGDELRAGMRPKIEEYLNEVTLPIRQAALIARLIAFAMVEPHQKGIVHRDLKPDNIQIDEEHHQPVIMDFGLAHFDMPDQPQLTQDGQLMGTPYYLFPEQAARRSPEIGPLTDLHALGVMLYEMLTGQRPIPPNEHRPQIDQTLSDLCLKAIAKTPAERFGSMAEFAKVLASYLKTMKG
jgi:serine/threonine-protein kinase